MNEQIQIDDEDLFLEITLYLAVVDVYRAEHCEPTWRPELPQPATADEYLRAAKAEHAPSAH